MAITKEVLGTIDLTREIVTDASDTFVQDATYVKDAKTLVIRFNEGKSDISVCLSSLSDAYTADEETLTLSGNEFSVKDGEFVRDLKGERFDMDSMKLGEYLSVLTQRMGGSAI